MITLVASSGFAVWGCARSVVLPHSRGIANTPASAPPGVVRIRPHSFRQSNPQRQSRPRQLSVPVLSSKPWKPNVAARDWNSIVIHHTAAPSGSVESIHETHLKRKDRNGNHWQGIGYHFVIGNGKGMPDGQIEPTFRWRQQMHGAHAGIREFNERGIGIALVGNFEKNAPSPAQLASVRNLVGALKAQYGITSDNVIGHGDIKPTECPGKHFPLADISQRFPDALVGETTNRRTPAKLAALNGSREQ